MAKKTLKKGVGKVVKIEGGYRIPFTIPAPVVPAPIAHEFGNGDVNIIRDKINEIIKHLS